MCLNDTLHPRTATTGNGSVGPERQPSFRRAPRAVRTAILGAVLAALLGVGTAGVAHAAGDSTVSIQAMSLQAVSILAEAKSVEQVLTNVRNWVVGILALLATVFLTIGGVRYILGGGEPGEIEKAKTAFRGACVGYALALLAPLVVSVLQGIVGG